MVNAVHVFYQGYLYLVFASNWVLINFLTINITNKMLITSPYGGISFPFWWITDFLRMVNLTFLNFLRI